MSEGVVGIDEGSLKNRHFSDTCNLDPDKMGQRVLAEYSVPLTAFRVWDALQTNLPGTSATDDLGLITGTFGTDAVYIGTSDLKAAGATSRYARVLIPLPPNY